MDRQGDLAVLPGAGAADDPAARPIATRATRLVFLIAGLGAAVWAPLVPDAKLRLGLDDISLGVVLLALGGGALAMMPLAGWFAARLGGRAVMLGLGLVFCACIPLLALAPDTVTLAVALAMFGAALGGVDVAVNAQAVVVEAARGRPMMSGFHGCYSLGGLAGGALMSVLLAFGLSPSVAASMAAALCVLLLLAQAGGLLARTGRRAAGAERSRLIRPGWRLVLIGVLCGVAFLAEGAVLDWAAVLLRFHRGADAAAASLGYAAFSLAMVAGRFTGDGVIARWRAVPVMRWGSVLAAAGFVLAAAVPTVPATLLGCALVGLGAANVVPVLFGFAGQIPGVAPSVAIAAAATPGYAGLLAGPVLVGLMAGWVGLPAAIGAIALLVLSITLLGPVAAGRGGKPS